MLKWIRNNGGPMFIGGFVVAVIVAFVAMFGRPACAAETRRILCWSDGTVLTDLLRSAGKTPQAYWADGDRAYTIWSDINGKWTLTVVGENHDGKTQHCQTAIGAGFAVTGEKPPKPVTY